MKDYTGIKSNKLTALSFVKIENKKTYWLFQCDCGIKKILKPYHVFDKIRPVKSCGCLKEDKSKFYIESTKKLLFRNYKKGAKTRNYNFCLHYDYFKEIIFKNCFYCGAEPSREQKHPTKKEYSMLCNGIDRKNNYLGYTIDNCVPCCKICNVAKSDLTYDVFINWIQRFKNT